MSRGYGLDVSVHSATSVLVRGLDKSCLPRRQLSIGEVNLDLEGFRIDCDHIAILDKPNWAAHLMAG